MKQLQQLEEDSGIISSSSHFASVCAAIAAYCHGQDTKLMEILKKIPYRSPYRDLSTILKALIRLPEPSQAALNLLSSLPAISPFAKVARVVKLAIADQSDWQGQWMTIGSASRAFAAQLRGIDLDVLHASSTIPVISLSSFDNRRIQALTAEKEQGLQTAIEHWQAALQLLAHQKDDTCDLKSALILRRIAGLYCQQLGPFAEAIEQPLLASLDHDPVDPETFLTLIRFYQAMGETDNYRLCVERAIRQCPQQTEILLIAVDLAIQRDTFKKAVHLAQRILQQDPMNLPVRQLLIQAHLAHARKQILAGRSDLSKKELDAAEDMQHNGFKSGLIDIIRGVLAYRTGENIQGEMCIEQGCHHSGYRIGYFRAVVEGQLLEPKGRWVKLYQKLLKQSARETPNESEIIGLLAVIQDYSTDHQRTALTAGLHPLMSYLRKSARLKYNRDEMEMICECWWKIAHFQLLLDFSEQAEQHWPDQPLFIFFRIYSLSNGLLDRLRTKDLENLSGCLESAEQRGEMHLVGRIQSFIQSPQLLH